MAQVSMRCNKTAWSAPVPGVLYVECAMGAGRRRVVKSPEHTSWSWFPVLDVMLRLHEFNEEFLTKL